MSYVSQAAMGYARDHWHDMPSSKLTYDKMPPLVVRIV